MVVTFSVTDDLFFLRVKVCSVLDLKKLIEQKSGIAVEFQSLFFREERLEDVKILTDYPRMCSGSALYLARKPLTVETLDCFGGEKSFLKIPRNKVNSVLFDDLSRVTLWQCCMICA